MPSSFSADEGLVSEESVDSPFSVVIDAGDLSEDLSLISGGNTWPSYFDIPITNVPAELNETTFRTHRSGEEFFNYTIGGFSPGETAAITLGFAENYHANCHDKKRIFDIKENGRVFATDLDVHGTVGCYTALLLTKKDCTADENGKFTINFAGVNLNTMVSLIIIGDGSVSFESTTSASAAPVKAPAAVPVAAPAAVPVAAPAAVPAAVPVAAPAAVPVAAPAAAPVAASSVTLTLTDATGHRIASLQTASAPERRVTLHLLDLSLQNAKGPLTIAVEQA